MLFFRIDSVMAAHSGPGTDAPAFDIPGSDAAVRNCRTGSNGCLPKIRHCRAKLKSTLPVSKAPLRPTDGGAVRSSTNNHRSVILCSMNDDMLSEIYPPFNPRDVVRLRAETEAVCEAIEVTLGQLAATELNVEDVRRVFQSEQQPRAQSLATALLHYVPDDDPDIILLSRTGNVRKFKSDMLNTISEGLIDDIASTQLETVVRMLRKLLTYLPQN